jgi:glycosyltransferase involved in cell wall biosynthesis
MDKVILIGNHPNDGRESMDRFVNLLWQALKERGIEVEVIKPKRFMAKLANQGTGLGKWLAYIDKFVVFPRRLRRRLEQLSRSGTRFVVHICDQADAVYVPSISKFPHVITCHDLIAIRSALDEFPEYPTRATGKIYQKWTLNGLRQASAVVCDTEATRADFLRVAGANGKNVSMIKIALNYPYRPMIKEEAQPLIDNLFHRCGMERPDNYLFHVGGNQWYKNRRGLVRICKALTRIAEPPPLVLAGQPPSPELQALIQSENLQNRVFAIGKVSNEELNALYSQAEALVFPSLIEGFGWPVIEAQACGCPVIASDIEVLKEVAGDGACYITVADIPTAAVAIRAFLALPQAGKTAQVNKGFQNAATFSVSRMLDEYLNVYRSICPPTHAKVTHQIEERPS